MGNLLRRNSEPVFAFPPARSPDAENFNVFIKSLRDRLKSKGVKTVLEKIGDNSGDLIAFRGSTFIELHLTSDFVGNSAIMIQYIGGDSWRDAGGEREGVVKIGLFVDQICSFL